ncbi:MAG: DUF4870 domain-containing protein, partial [Propionicimonas sp.]
SAPELTLDDAEPATAPIAALDAVDAPEAPLAPVVADLDLPEPEPAFPIYQPPPAAPQPPAFSAPSQPAYGQPSTPAWGQAAPNYTQPSFGQPAASVPAAQPSPPIPQPPYAQQAYAEQQYPEQQYPGQPYAQQPYPQQPAGGLQPYPQQAPSLSPTEETTWAAAAHWSALLAGLVGAGFLGPLLVLLIQGPKSPRVRANAVESLNFEITFVIAMIASVLLTLILVGLLGLIFFPILWLILRIVASVQTANGQDFRYPLNIRMVK